MARTASTTRDRIVQAAGRLFQGEGIRAVSVDAVAAKAGITKRTLYYHFRSKDDLIAAYLAAHDQPNLSLFQKWYAETQGDAADKVAGIFRNLAQTARHPKWKGCGFLRTSVELIDMPGHPAVVVGRAHKKRVEDWLCAELEHTCCDADARALARQVMLLLDGAFSVVLLHRDASYMDTAADAAASLLRACRP